MFIQLLLDNLSGSTLAPHTYKLNLPFLPMTWHLSWQIVSSPIYPISQTINSKVKDDLHIQWSMTPSGMASLARPSNKVIVLIQYSSLATAMAINNWFHWWHPQSIKKMPQVVGVHLGPSMLRLLIQAAFCYFSEVMKINWHGHSSRVATSKAFAKPSSSRPLWGASPLHSQSAKRLCSYQPGEPKQQLLLKHIKGPTMYKK